jgi:hypothetical protein
LPMKWLPNPGFSVAATRDVIAWKNPQIADCTKPKPRALTRASRDVTCVAER